LDKEAGKSISIVKRKIYKRTRLKQKKMRIKVDTSDYVIEEVLFMECENR